MQINNLHRLIGVFFYNCFLIENLNLVFAGWLHAHAAMQHFGPADYLGMVVILPL
jgi:hypothetical protein